MDPGTAISVVSLTFQIFAGCIQGYQLLTDAKNTPEDYQYLRVRLKTEQYRLLDWADVVKLDETDENLLISNNSKAVLQDVLNQQHKLLFTFGRVDDKYRKLRKPMLVELMDADGKIPNPPAYEEATSPTLQRVETSFHRRFPQKPVLLKKSLEWFKAARTFPKQMRWATFDAEKMEKLVGKLSAFNDYLEELLNQSQMKQLSNNQERTAYQITQLNSRFDELAQLVQSALAINQHRRSKIPTSHMQAYLNLRGLGDEEEAGEKTNGDEALVRGLAGLAQFKAVNIAIEEHLPDNFANDLKLGHSAAEIKDVELSRADIDVEGDADEDADGNEAQRSEATYTDPKTGVKKTVWIEWKTFDQMMYNDRDRINMVHERVKQLTTLLKENNRTKQIRAPRCLGYFRDSDGDDYDEYNHGHGGQGADHGRFGLVFEKPVNVDASTRPTSLLELLKREASNPPSLTQRIKLAARIAECIERLHAVNWLHKGLRSSNILFFSSSSPSSSDPHIDLTQPYIAGFDYSRPAQNDDMTERPPENAAADIYRHPKVQGAMSYSTSSYPSSTRNPNSASAGGNFKKSYDIYSLGVILLEIAYWKSIDRILEIPDIHAARPSVTNKVRARLIEEKTFLGWVRSWVGETYAEVARACLVGPQALGVDEREDERIEEVGAELGRGFYVNVVERLVDMKV